MSLLEAQEISKSFGGIRSLDGCGVSVEEGRISGLIGPNGSGKTTLFNVMTGYEPIQQGEVRFNGRHITNASPDAVFALGIGRTFQLTRIFPRLTVLENVHVAAQRRGLRSLLGRWSSSREQKEALDLLDFVGIAGLKDEPAGNLSYGQKTLLEFASLLVAEPRVVLLDEPAGGINPVMIAQLSERIRALNQRGITFLIVEHNMEFVMNLCAWVMVMHQGTKIAEGTPQEVRANPAVLDAYLGSVEMAGGEHAAGAG